VEEVTQQFIRACTDGDVETLLDVLANEVVLWTDSGGKVKAARNPIVGIEKVVRFLLGIRRIATPVTHKITFSRSRF
jgi:RNA polymerase sigma-70 factor (ECF subfamily)